MKRHACLVFVLLLLFSLFPASAGVGDHPHPVGQFTISGFTDGPDPVLTLTSVDEQTRPLACLVLVPLTFKPFSLCDEAITEDGIIDDIDPLKSERTITDDINPTFR